VQRPPRPDKRPSGYQNWRELLFVHWTFAPEEVRKLVPPQLELDLWDGRAYVGVVPFAMEGVRPARVPRALAFDFLETNLRTYVRRGDRAGVYFFSLEAASFIAVKAARWGWGLPYFHASMSMHRDGDVIAYESERRDRAAPRHRVRYRIGEMLGASKPGTLEYFLLERYLLFSTRGERVFEGQVEHVPYPAQRVELLEIEDDLIAAAGLPRPTTPPVTAHYAAGVDVEVFGPWAV
jgi:uncharacterized protein YqjF (DUF2071 family)